MGSQKSITYKDETRNLILGGKTTLFFFFFFFFFEGSFINEVKNASSCIGEKISHLYLGTFEVKEHKKRNSRICVMKNEIT
jgi:hypothetical protein